MDNKTIFARTSKGEDEVKSRTSHLPGDVKRALLMVDGSATFGEISKRAAPSMRASLGEMLQELEKSGFIQDKTMDGKIPKVAVPPKMAVPPGMAVPTRMATPHKKQAVDNNADELDFMSGFTASPPEAPTAGAVRAEKLRAEAEEKSRQEIEAEKIRAQREAEDILLKAGQEAARIREETARRAREEAENARLKAEQEAKRVREELEAARLKIEHEAKLRLEAAAREGQQAEAARLVAEQEARKVREELEAARLKAEQETRRRFEAAAKERQQAEAAHVKAEQEAAQMHMELEAAKLRAEQEAKAHARIKAEEEAAKAREAAELNEADKPMPIVATTTRSISATVLFFDVVGYTKQSVNKQIEIKRQFNQVVSGCLKTHGGGEHIILDTGDGAAIGFLQHPEDALDVAIKFRKTVMANQHLDYPDLKVRIGIHLGPINIVKDMNGQSNMVGDGINDAQRVMSFAGIDRIYISRPYYDYVSRLNDEYADMFRYRGMQEDKHGREHPVYELADTSSAEGAVLPQGSETAAEKQPNPFTFDSFQVDQPLYPSESHVEKKPEKISSPVEAAPAAKPGTFAFDSFHVDESQRPAEPHKNQQPSQKVSAAQQPGDVAKTTQPADVRQPARQQVSPPAASEPAESQPSQEQIKQEAQERIAAEQRIAAEAQAKELADAQARVWAEAEQRALEVARANTERAAHQAEYSVADTRHVEKPVPVARVRRKPFAWGRLVGFVFKLGVFLLVLLVGVLFVVPYVLPMRDYMPKVQQLLSERLHQPVHLGYLSGRILPTPRLVLGEIYIGEVKQFQAGQAQINFSITGLFGDKKPINSVEFQDVKVSGAGLQNATAWLQQLASIDQYPVSRMVINQGTLDADAFQLAGIEGELNFNPVGKFTQANLRANAGKFTLGINATPENNLQVAITVRDNTLPLLPNWSFDELNAKGELSSDELQISDFDARILGGVVQGNASINWRSGWRAQGALSAKAITMQKLNKLLDGNVEGSARFKMTSLDLAGLIDSVVLDGSFMANDGMISGMDIVETARMRSKVNLPGGRTHFDGLSGVISYANNAYHFKQVKVAAGMLNATATFDVNKQQLSGKMNVSLSMHEGTAPVDLQMGGATDSPTLRYAP